MTRTPSIPADRLSAVISSEERSNKDAESNTAKSGKLPKEMKHQLGHPEMEEPKDQWPFLKLLAQGHLVVSQWQNQLSWTHCPVVRAEDNTAHRSRLSSPQRLSKLPLKSMQTLGSTGMDLIAELGPVLAHTLHVARFASILLIKGIPCAFHLTALHPGGQHHDPPFTYGDMEGKRLAQSHPPGQRPSWEQNSGLVRPKPISPRG